MYDPLIHAALTQAAALPRWARGWTVMQACRAVLWRHAWQVAVMCVAVCLMLWSLRPQVALLNQLAYSLSMGMLTWLLIEGGRFFVDQDSPYLFPRGWRGVALIGGGVLLGFLGGQLVGDAINGYDSFSLLRHAPDLFAYIFLFSMASGIGISLFFYNQGKSAYYQAELEARSRQATEAQLKLLQSQLDPHMLFNTLANLRVLIQSDPARAVQMLDQLGDFLRSTLAASRASEHSLQAEFDRLTDYLALMQIRMGKRLEYSLQLPPALAQQIVPTLILQSLVENAIVHGLEPKLKGGRIAITASEEAQYLVLRVQDDGLGFDAAQLQEGFGIAQVRERLRSRYGSQATIELIAIGADNIRAVDQKDLKFNSATSQQTGSQVTLRIPLPV